MTNNDNCIKKLDLELSYTPGMGVKPKMLILCMASKFICLRVMKDERQNTSVVFTFMIFDLLVFIGGGEKMTEKHRIPNWPKPNAEQIVTGNRHLIQQSEVHLVRFEFVKSSFE